MAIVASFLLVAPVAQNDQNVEPLVQAQVEDRPIQPLDPPVLKVPEEPTVVKPPIKGPPEDPPVVKPPPEDPPVVKPAVKRPLEEPPVVKPPVKAPPVFAKNDFVPLFNGKDLTGWRLQKQSADIWRVENGILIADGVNGKMGRLNTEIPQPKDFHLRVEVRVADKGTSSLRFRCPVDANIGYSTQFVFQGGKLNVGGLGMQTPTLAHGFPRIVEPIVAAENGSRWKSWRKGADSS